jgi:GH15 family glucan-1,4-alpha-glucosidase
MVEHSSPTSSNVASRRDFLRAGSVLAAGAAATCGLAIGRRTYVAADPPDLGLDAKTLDKLQKMWSAAWESIAWRQDHYGTGGIVESDERVDGGRKLYWPWCWQRNYVVEPMLKQKHFDRERRFLEFWEKCQEQDGCWRHCYDIRNHKGFAGGEAETDNVGYMLWDVWAYVDATEDLAWLRKHESMVLRAAEFLMTKFRPDLQLIWGVEEGAEIDETTGNTIPWPAGYTTHINAVCAKGLRCAGELAGKLGKPDQAKKYAQCASQVQKSIENRLFDEKKGTYCFGILEDGTRVTGSLWLALMPGYVNNCWNDRVASTFEYLWKRNHGHDPKIPQGYWSRDYRPVIGKKESHFFNYSGVGPNIGTSPAIAHLLLLGGDTRRAKEQIELFTQFTNDSNLIPEHINTIHPGKTGTYGCYPDGHYWVDSGNLFHMSFFLRLISTFPKLLGSAEGVSK